MRTTGGPRPVEDVQAHAVDVEEAALRRNRALDPSRGKDGERRHRRDFEGDERRRALEGPEEIGFVHRDMSCASLRTAPCSAATALGLMRAACGDRPPGPFVDRPCGLR